MRTQHYLQESWFLNQIAFPHTLRSSPRRLRSVSTCSSKTRPTKLFYSLEASRQVRTVAWLVGKGVYKDTADTTLRSRGHDSDMPGLRFRPVCLCMFVFIWWAVPPQPHRAEINMCGCVFMNQHLPSQETILWCTKAYLLKSASLQKAAQTYEYVSTQDQSVSWDQKKQLKNGRKKKNKDQEEVQSTCDRLSQWSLCEPHSYFLGMGAYTNEIVAEHIREKFN